MQPEDRSGGRAARGGERENRGEPRRERVALEPRLDPGDEHEDGRHGRERELEAGLEQAVRIPREQDGSADEQEVPAVARTRREPGERREPAGHPRPHDGRLPAHREHVGEHGCKGADLPDPAREAESPGEEDHPSDDIGDVLARHSEQVVEAGGPEAVAELLVEAFVLAEDDACEHRPALTGRDRVQGAGDAAPQPVRDRTEPSSPADHPEAPSTQDDVDPLAPEVRRLVEAAFRLGAARARDGDDELEQRTLRRGPLRGQVEARALPKHDPAKAQDANRNADGELAPPRRACHLDAREGGAADPIVEDARVEGLETRAPPPQAREDESDGQQRETHGRQGDREQPGSAGGQREPGVGLAAEEGQREARAERGGEEVRRRHPPEEVGSHPAVKGPRAVSAARVEPARCRGLRRAPRRSRTRRWSPENRRSAAQSPARCRAERRAARSSPS